MSLLNTGTTTAMTTAATTFMEDWIVPQYQYFQSEIVPRLGQAVPQLGDVYERMDIPSWEIFSLALKRCGGDVIVATQSTCKVAYMTIKPFIILLYIIGEFLFHVLHILSKLLLSQGLVSLQKGLMQAKAGIIWFYLFQRSLSKEEILGEIAIGFILVLLYYFRKWLKRQTYYERATKWYQQKKTIVFDYYTKTVNRLAQVSLALAMAIPHGMFAGICLAFKVFFPRVFTWLAADTYATALLSIWYPLISTIALIHNCSSLQKQLGTEATIAASPKVQDIRESYENKSSSASTSGNNGKPSKTTGRSRPSYLKQTAAQRSREQNTKSRRTKTGFYPRTSPSSKKSSAVSKTQQSALEQEPPVGPAEYWLQYWVIYAMVQAIGRALYLIPLVGGFLTKHPMVLALAVELKLVFFIWFFGMEQTLSQVVDAQQQDAVLVKTLPRNLLYKQCSNILTEFHAIVAEAVTRETWDAFVVSKSRRVLEVFVMVRFLSEPFKDWLLHMLEEGRALVVPSISLLMPGFITQFGILYVQYLLPSAKSSMSQKQEQREENNDDDRRLLHLKYWVMHSLWAGCLSYFSSILWWIPFSTHVVYLTWCHLSFPRTVQQYYGIFELELIGFGLLRPREDHGDVAMDVHETKTAKLLKNLSKRLPSAASEEDAVENNNEGSGNEEEGGDPSTETATGQAQDADSSMQDTEPDLLTQVNSEESAAPGGQEAEDETSKGEVGGNDNSDGVEALENLDAESDEKTSPITSSKSPSSTTTLRQRKVRSGSPSLVESGSDSNEENDENQLPGAGVRRSTRSRRRPTERTNF